MEKTQVRTRTNQLAPPLPHTDIQRFHTNVNKRCVLYDHKSHQLYTMRPPTLLYTMPSPRRMLAMLLALAAVLLLYPMLATSREVGHTRVCATCMSIGSVHTLHCTRSTNSAMSLCATSCRQHPNHLQTTTPSRTSQTTLWRFMMANLPSTALCGYVCVCGVGGWHHDVVHTRNTPHPHHRSQWDSTSGRLWRVVLLHPTS